MLLSSEKKEQKWQKFFESNTENKINWIKSEQNVTPFYIIAIKPDTEKVEEAVREIRNEYPKKIKGNVYCRSKNNK